MNDRSFTRVGGILGILIAVDSILAVIVYFTIVPAAQRLIPFQGADAFLASLSQDSAGLQLYYLLFALIPVFTLLPVTAVYFRVRRVSETWSLFALLLGMIGGFLWMLYGFQQLEQYRYLAGFVASSPDLARNLFNAPQVLNPFGGITGGFISVWFLITGVLLLRTDASKLVALVAFIAFADLLVGFVASVAGISALGNYTAAIAGAVGGPLFWVLAGLDLLRYVAPERTPGMPTLVIAK